MILCTDVHSTNFSDACLKVGGLVGQSWRWGFYGTVPSVFSVNNGDLGLEIKDVEQKLLQC